MPELDEFSFIARFFQPLTGNDPGAFGLADDAAMIGVQPGERLVVTVDTIVEGVHFLSSDPPDSIGAKALGVNLSDLASMGSRPRAYVMSVCLPRDWDQKRLLPWMDGFCRGLGSMQTQQGMHLIGGDTVSAPGPMAITITAFGVLEGAIALRRAGAHPGDIVFVSGTIGDAALGLEILKGHILDLDPAYATMLTERYRRPLPRVALGQHLLGLASAAADISDGLVADLAHICQASNTCATIAVERVPFSAAARACLAQAPHLLPLLVSGGDDYELVFAASPDREDDINQLARELGVPLTAIGTIEPEPPDALNDRSAGTMRVRVIDRNGVVLKPEYSGYRHI
ncbi:MAG: thiamine-phosphate kinase [Hyphomicrobiales bacterium]|nr:thiamine-phosphate kinase [Hyphomicrobiales bacterium]